MDSRHSFSFGRHFDAANTRHGLLLVNNDDAARLAPGRAIEVPDAPFLHLYLARGAVLLEGAGALQAGDAVRFTATGGQRITATESAELLVWELHARAA